MNQKRLIVIIILLIIIIVSGILGLFDDNTQGLEKFKYDKHFYLIPPSFWLKIGAFDIYSIVIVFVVIIFGIASYFMGYFTGVKINKAKVIASIAVATVVGILGRSLNLLIKLKLYYFLVNIIPEEIKDKTLIAASISDTLIYITWIIFITGIAVYLYEALIITAEEAHPMGG